MLAKFFYDFLPKYLSDDIENLQKRACRIMLPDHRYNEALDQLATFTARRQALTKKRFSHIVNYNDNKLHGLLPPVNSSEIYLRGRRLFQNPYFKCKYVIELIFFSYG